MKRRDSVRTALAAGVGTPIEALMFTMGDGRTVLHDTQVGELWRRNVKRWPR